MDAYDSRGSTKPATTDSGKEPLLKGESNNEEAQKEFRRPTKTVVRAATPIAKTSAPARRAAAGLRRSSGCRALRG